MSKSVRLHRWQPTRLSRPWDSPGKNTGVGCHFLLQCMKVKGQSEVTQSCPTLSDPMDCGLPGSSVHGIFQQQYWSGVPLPSPGYSLPCHIILYCVSCDNQISSLNKFSYYNTNFFTYLLLCLLNIQDLFIYSLFVCSLNNTSLSSFFSC